MKKLLKSGILADNDRLPTESELCEVYGISDIVVKNAYKLLVKEGLIIRVQGSGTFVSTRRVYRFPLKGFHRISDFSGYTYQSKTKRVIMFDQTSGSDRVFDMLKLKKTDTYYVIKYVVLIENAEVLLQTLHLPVKLFPKLTIQDVEANNLPQLLSSRYQHTIHQVKNGFSPVNLSSSEALLLNTFKHAAAHRVRTTIMDQSERPIAYLETLFLGQFTQFEVLLG